MERFLFQKEVDYNAENAACILQVNFTKHKNEYLDEEISSALLKGHLQETQITISGKKLMIVSYHKSKLVLSRFNCEIEKAEEAELATGEKLLLLKSANGSEIKIHKSGFFTVAEAKKE